MVLKHLNFCEMNSDPFCSIPIKTRGPVRFQARPGSNSVYDLFRFPYPTQVTDSGIRTSDDT